jgi:hypothetical protein
VGPLEVAAGELADPAADRAGAGEREDPHLVGHDQGLADVGATGKHLKQSRRQAGFLEDPGDHHAADDRGARVRFEEDCVAEGERRRHGAVAEDDRHVERRDHANDARRQPPDQRQPRLLARHQFPVGTGGQGDRLLALLHRDAHGEAGHRLDRTDLPHVPRADLVGVLPPEVARAAQHRGARGVRQGGPVPLGARRGAGRSPDVVGRGPSGAADLLARGGLDDGCAAAGALLPLPVNEDRPGLPVRVQQSYADLLVVLMASAAVTLCAIGRGVKVARRAPQGTRLVFTQGAPDSCPLVITRSSGNGIRVLTPAASGCYVNAGWGGEDTPGR